jgi:carbon storage regulator
MEERIMLVLSRKAGESIHIDGTIKVTIVTVHGNRVKVGIEAPAEVPIVRSELQDVQERTEICPTEIDCDARMNPARCSF